MNFKAHLNAGVVAGAISAAAAIGVGPGESHEFLAVTDSAPPQLTFAAICFAAAVAMSLFPDLDTTSVPQRWFSRSILILLVIALSADANDRSKAFALTACLSFVFVLTTVHGHRGWTHWRITPWLIAGVLAAIREYHRARSAWFSDFAWDRVADTMIADWPIVLACVLGHYSHLLLDGVLFKRPRLRLG